MPRHKAFLPSTYVPGFKVHRDKLGAIILHTDPAQPALLGKPMVTMAAPIGNHLHFRNHAARLKVCAALGRDPTKDLEITPEELKQHAKHFVRVPMYRGFDSVFANHIRSGQRRDERIKQAKSLMARAGAMIDALTGGEAATA